MAEALKNKGNLGFQNKDYLGAATHYLHSIAIFRHFPADSDALRSEDDLVCDSEAQREEVSKLVNILFLNLSQCYLETKAFENAFLASDQAMRIDDKNLKAYYRQTRALEGMDKPESLRQAIDCIEVGLQFCATEQDRQRFEQMRRELIVRLDEKLGVPKRMGSAFAKATQTLLDDAAKQLSGAGKVCLAERTCGCQWN